ncbi:uncharacterized protein LY79DRAFT_275246 [Colletotrichum navitas]|uniref:Uncharacterized protein n=1 Tax=Colletotrichum navitas TaxID=681940 RepID=A0AAD8V2S9_9PEZI|nr:uncharacterized protein LY79DRAFT_275246 [Colletotrichum navitas]KAK1585113.1 hypothetical protein LY79DRAFT_275246 [Colletotrichum navitas]
MTISRKRSLPEAEVEAEAKPGCDEPTSFIDFDDTPPFPADVVPLPNDADDLETLTGKIGALVRVVSRKSSLAVWTAFAATPNPQRDPFAIAKADADVRELQMFTWFEGNGRRLHTPEPFDVTRNVRPLEKQNNKTAARYEDMASCVDEVFGTQGATKENVCWIVENLDVALPLIKFYLRVKRARRNLLGGQATLTSNELAEYQTVRRIRGVLGVRLQKCRMDKGPAKQLREYDVVLLRRQNLTSPILKGQREEHGRTEAGRECAKRQRCAV